MLVPYVILIIISIPALFGLLYLIRKSRIVNRLGFTQYFIKKEVSFVSYVCGCVGAGKTTFSCGLTNTLTDILIKKAINNIKRITTILYDVDFTKMDGIILSYFNKGIFSEQQILKRILTENDYKAAFNEKKYDSYMKIIPVVTLVKDYITAQLAIYRNNYVYYYKSGFYSIITKNNAMPFFPEMMDIKNRSRDKDYSILPYSVIFEDEKQISKNKASNFQQTAKEDGGANMFIRLIRHLGKSSMYYVTTSQEFDGADKHERNLATSIIFITGRKNINLYVLTNFLLRLIKAFLDYIFNLKYDFKEISELDRYKTKSNVKHAIFRIEQLLRKNYSKSFLKYDVIIYHSPKDVDKNIRFTTYGAKKASLIFPIKYCFGSVDTYAFSTVQEFLIKNSKSLNFKSTTSEADFVQHILEKDRAEKKTSEKKAKKVAKKA